MRRRRRSSEELTTSDAFTLSISDLMAGLLAVFVLALSYYMVDYQDAVSQLSDNSERRKAMLGDIEQQMQGGGFSVKIDAAQGTLTIPEGVLFDSADAEVKEDGKAVLHKLGDVLKEILADEKYAGKVETIFIEGHTDSDQMQAGAKYATNWELSAQRAINTWNELRTYDGEGVGLETLKNRHDPPQPLFSVAGYADTRPLDEETKETEEGKEKNRRIEFRFTMTPPSEKDPDIIRNIKDKL